MSPTIVTFLFEAANFVVFAALLGWLFFKPVRRLLEKQRETLERNRTEAAQILADAERARKEADEQRRTLAAEGDHLRAEAKEAAKRDAETVIEAARRRQGASGSRSREAQRLVTASADKLASAVVSASSAMVLRLLEAADGSNLEDALVRSACRELARDGNAASDSVTVESASPLDSAARQLIESSLSPGHGKAEYRVVPALKGGVRIITEHGLIDASLAGLASFAGRAIAEQIASGEHDDVEAG